MKQTTITISRELTVNSRGQRSWLYNSDWQILPPLKGTVGGYSSPKSLRLYLLRRLGRPLNFVNAWDKPTYTLEAGRNIYRGGQPFISIGREGETAPCSADDAAHAITAALNILEEARVDLSARPNQIEIDNAILARA